MAWHKSSAASRGYGKRHRLIRRWLLATEPLCRECNKRGILKPATIADHIVPKSQGGTDELDNYQPLCKPCHDDKTARESAQAQGFKWKPKPTYGRDGWPID